jgi:N-acetylglucosamine kinase-like BadF-type ATPase
VPNPPTSAIGIDAGGSKTRIAFGSIADLTALQTETLGPGNFRQLGLSGTRALIRDIISRCQIQNPSDTLVVGGFAGAGTVEGQDAIRSVLVEEGFHPGNVRSITSDGGLLLWALGNDGIALIAGTGSICIGRRKGSTATDYVEARAGGYGYRLASEVGGYGLGIGAIDAAVRIEDGRRQQPTALYELVGECFRLSDLQQIIPHLYPTAQEKDEVREKVATLASGVLGAAAAKDAVAMELVEKTVDELADLVQAVFHKLGARPSDVGLHGGLFTDPHARDLLLDPLKQHEAIRELPLKFESLGVKQGDRDPLLEAMRFVSASSS